MYFIKEVMMENLNGIAILILFYLFLIIGSLAKEKFSSRGSN